MTQTPQQCLHLSLPFLKDWTAAQQKKEPGRSGGHCQKETRWKLPSSGYVKCNVDAAIFLDMKAFGVGMVLRDDSGRIIDCNMRRLQGWCQPQEAEAIGIIEALSWLRGRNTGTVILEMDGKAVFDAIQGEGAGLSEFGQLIQEGKGKWKATQPGPFKPCVQRGKRSC